MSALEFAERILTLALSVPISVTSWGRTAKRNKNVGGVVNSHHLTWTGLDAVPDDFKTKPQATQIARRLGLELLDEQDHWHIEPA